MMKIIFAKKIGFCSGVKRAIRITEEALEENNPLVQFLGSLVHNEQVINLFQKKGVKFRKSLKEAKPGILIIQAHGTPPFKNSNKKILIRDATCPLVKKVQLIAGGFHKKGYQVIILGDKDHSETRGIKGHTNNKAIVVEDAKEAKGLPGFKKIGFVAQTTQSVEKFQEVLRVLKEKADKLVFENTICPEVASRQKELTKIIESTDGILIIGSRSSANTRRMVEKAKKFKKKVFWANSLEELILFEINGINKLGVVSGTSAPNWEINKIRRHLLNSDD